MSASLLVDHFFRHEYGRLVATLSRQLGVQHLEAIEDAVQSALMAALDSWKGLGPPDNPSAWLYRVARNNVLGELRKQSRRGQILEQQATEARTPTSDAPGPVLAGEVEDDLLRMLFVCCDDALALESRIVLALKTLCGFDVREIAHRLFTSEANVYKRLERGRQGLRNASPNLAELGQEEYSTRLPTVHHVLYLLFTEGHLSANVELAVRRDLCDEAIRLTTILARHPVGNTPQTCALLALMHLHAARLDSREDASGGLVLLEDQDRSVWDQHQIQTGLTWLAESARGDEYCRYHAEAAIAAEHCLAPSFEETRWDKVAECYSLLEKMAPSVLHRLNRAVAVAEWKGPVAGLAVLDGAWPPTRLVGSYLWSAVLADLHRRSGHLAEAERHRTAALASAPTPAVRALLQRRLHSLEHQ